MNLDLQILDTPLDLGACVKLVSMPESGGIQVFIGVVRNQTQGKKVICLEYEAYVSMALKELDKIAARAATQWPVQAIAVHHRTGKLIVGETAVIVAISAAHRHAAIEACRFIIDTLKTTVPIWKKEIFEDGEVWVAAHP
ncbi:MAG: molybdenum cofactor biosynthesis protein MoaE [Saprospiraceae bacterium]|nr:molybdenum cofactor biosynthesis protein MoaE [Saprospiraceae bacterium]